MLPTFGELNQVAATIGERIQVDADFWWLDSSCCRLLVSRFMLLLTFGERYFGSGASPSADARRPASAEGPAAARGGLEDL